MAQLTAEQIQRTIEACRAHLTEMGESFRLSLDCNIRLSAEEPRPFSAAVTSGFDGPGLVVSIVLGDQGLVCLIPESVSLPNWYREPGISENNRLQSFANELSLHLLPDDIEADRFSSVAAANLKELAERAQIDPAMTLVLAAFQANAAETEAAIAKILIVVPVDVNRLSTPNEVTAAALEQPASNKAGNSDSKSPVSGSTGPAADSKQPSLDGLAGQQTGHEDHTSAPKNASVTAAISREQALRALRVLSVPVTVSVRLAERKMPLGQIVALVPGALVTFNKSCEDLLDLFVNNHRYCQGEAIKIGENFGLKVAKVGVTEERKEHVL
jgi:flagellar motor switch protein FliN/FliY